MKIRRFVPGLRTEPSIEVVRVTDDMQVLGRVRMPEGVARGVMRDGKIVAWAVARRADADGFRHITVETDVNHRRRGYAKACLQALVRDVEEPLVYLCEDRNINSARTALSAGFTEVL